MRFDNRDNGRSTRLSAVPPPTTMRLLARRFDPAQYTVDDLADDAAGLLDALGLAPAHVVGVSMGGHDRPDARCPPPDAVRSLTSIMSTTGARGIGQPAPSTLRLLVAKAPRARSDVIERAVRMFRHIGSHGFPFDDERIRAIAGQAYDRGYHPAGTMRQLAAIVKSGDRTRSSRASGARRW